ncbi:MAG: hypothetical protein KUF74_18340, partial [Candidatus Thiodiazotropha sp. (ex Ctena orbiculata)]|nr:hypothetical protein [Candidatus Thiodiazotropha taylori]
PSDELIAKQFIGRDTRVGLCPTRTFDQLGSKEFLGAQVKCHSKIKAADRQYLPANPNPVLCFD